MRHFLTQAFQLTDHLLPIACVCGEDVFHTVFELLVKGRILAFTQLDDDALADLVLHGRCFRLRAVVHVVDNLREIVRQDVHFRHSFPYSVRFQILVQKTAYLFACPFEVERVVLVMPTDEGNDIGHAFGWDIIVAACTRLVEKQVEDVEEQAEQGIQFRTELDALRNYDYLFANRLLLFPVGTLLKEVLDIGNTFIHKALDNFVVTHFKFRNLLFDSGEISLEFFQILSRLMFFLCAIDAQGLVQVLGDTELVHNQTVCLAFLGAVHTGNGLHQVVFRQVFVEIHHLLDGRIETCQQTVTNAKNAYT